MTRTLTALSAAALAAVLALPAGDAHAQYYHRHGGGGGAAAAGLLGGLAAGAIIGGAIANSRPAYGEPVYVAPPPPPPPYRGYAPVAGWAPYPAYAGPIPVGCPGGYWARQPLYDPYGGFMGYSRPRFFCP